MPSNEPLGALPDGLTRMGQTRIVPVDTSGLSFTQAMAKAQAIVDQSARGVVRVTGNVNSARYNRALKARDRVHLRGAGTSFNGEYKVSEVRHRIRPGSYEQGFVLTRGELGPKLPVVIP
jgi:ubiquinone/menaquinone biosynthesis C-methylase UbiE